jgi:hypothetical protein
VRATRELAHADQARGNALARVLEHAALKIADGHGSAKP